MIVVRNCQKCFKNLKNKFFNCCRVFFTNPLSCNSIIYQKYSNLEIVGAKFPKFGNRFPGKTFPKFGVMATGIVLLEIFVQINYFQVGYKYVSVDGYNIFPRKFYAAPKYHPFSNKFCCWSDIIGMIWGSSHINLGAAV